MNKYIGLTVGLSLIGGAAYAGSTKGSFDGALNQIVNGQPVYLSNGNPTTPNLPQGSNNLNGSGPGYQALVVAVPEPAGMAALAVFAGGLIARRRKASRL